jgi:hypothetical protein
MSNAEEILKWLCDELEKKQREHLGRVKTAVLTLQDHVNFQDYYEQERAVDTVLGLEQLGDELSDLASEAKQRLKEAKQQVAA